MPARMTDLADILREAGLPVREIPGWRTRGHGAMAGVRGVLCHHTAGSATGYAFGATGVNGDQPGIRAGYWK